MPPSAPPLAWTGLIAFSTERDGNSEIYTIDPAGTLTNVTDDPSDDRHPAWSPDGTKIAFSSDRDGDFEIWVMNADGSDPEQVTEGPGFDGMPDWSPEGDRIVFASDRAGNSDLFLTAADGVLVGPLTDDPDNEFSPEFSVDGRTILFDRDEGGTDLEILTQGFPSGDEVAISAFQPPATDISPTWFGPGILFASDRNGDFDLIVDANADGKGWMSLWPHTPGDDVAPAVSPGSHWIAFVSTRDGNEEIYVAIPDGTEVVRLTNDPTDDDDPDWAPNGP